MTILQKANAACMSEDTAKLLLRITVGFLMLLHGIFKIQNPESISFIGGLFENYGLPAFLAYLVYIGEVLAPLMLLVGFKTRLAAKLVAITMVVAILLAHAKDIFALTATGGAAIELQLLLLIGAVTISALGAGKYSLDAKKG